MASYEIRKKVGSGAFGDVYRASTADGSDAALKLVHKHISQSIDEEALLAAVNAVREAKHTSLARPFGLVHVDGQVGVLGEFVSGVDLGSLMTGGPVPIKAVLELGARAAGCLAAVWAVSGPDGRLHTRHGDLKPANMMLGADGTVKITDFGLAESNRPGGGLDPDSTAVFGSLVYMAPEKMHDRTSDGEDIYALSTILYILATADSPRAPTIVDQKIHTGRVNQMMSAFQKVVGEDHDAAGMLLMDGLAFEPGKRPSRSDMARRCQRLADTIDGVSLAEWAAQKVPAAVETRSNYKLQQDEQVIGQTIHLEHVEAFVPRPSDTPAPTRSRAKADWPRRPSTPALAPIQDNTPALILAGAFVFVGVLGIVGALLLL